MVGVLQMVQVVCLLTAYLFLAALWIGLRRRSNRSSEQKPTVSVLVAARDEEKNLPRLLFSLAAQDYPPDRCEFVIIDDGSTDRTGEITAEWAAKDGRFKSVRLEEPAQRRMGPKKRALTAGLASSRGEIILTTDADCTAPPGWISGIVHHFDPGISAVCGEVRFEKTPGFWARLTAFEGLVNTILNAAVIGIGGALSCLGANFAYRRSAFQNVEGYDRSSRSLSGDDDLLLQKLRSAEERIRFCNRPETTVYTCGPENAGDYWQRKRRHLSAAKRYAAHWILLAATIYLGCLLTVILSVLKLSGVFPGYLFLLAWGFFSLGLLITFFKGARRLEQRGWTLWAVVAALLFPISFIIIHILSLLPAPAWKGRTG